MLCQDETETDEQAVKRIKLSIATQVEAFDPVTSVISTTVATVLKV
jgi:hypothetical protein